MTVPTGTAPRRPSLVISVTAAAVVIDALISSRLGATATLPAYLYLGTIGAVLAAVDATSRRLPDAIIVPSYPIAAALLTVAAAATGNWTALGRAGLAMTCLAAGYLALALARPGGMGGGDIKLAGLLGLSLGWLGWTAVTTATLAAFGLAALGVAIRRVTGRTVLDGRIAFGPYMIAGALLAVVTAA